MHKKLIFILSLFFITPLQADIFTQKNLVTAGCASLLAPSIYSYTLWKQSKPTNKTTFYNFLKQQLKTNKKLKYLYTGTSLISLGCFAGAWHYNNTTPQQTPLQSSQKNPINQPIQQLQKTKTTINMIPSKQKLTKIATPEEKKESNECQICYEILDNQETAFGLFKCSHGKTVHKSCCKDLTRCAFCKAPLTSARESKKEKIDYTDQTLYEFDHLEELLQPEEHFDEYQELKKLISIKNGNFELSDYGKKEELELEQRYIKAFTKLEPTLKSFVEKGLLPLNFKASFSSYDLALNNLDDLMATKKSLPAILNKLIQQYKNTKIVPNLVETKSFFVSNPSPLDKFRNDNQKGLLQDIYIHPGDIFCSKYENTDKIPLGELDLKEIIFATTNVLIKPFTDVVTILEIFSLKLDEMNSLQENKTQKSFIEFISIINKGGCINHKLDSLLNFSTEFISIEKP